MKNFTKRIIIWTSIYFTVLTFIFALINLLLYGGSENGGLLSSARTLFFFVFSLVFAASNELLRTPAHRSLSVALHALLTGTGFYLFMILPAEIKGTPAFLGILLYYVIYAVIATAVLIVISRAEKKKNREKEYHSIVKNR